MSNSEESKRVRKCIISKLKGQLVSTDLHRGRFHEQKEEACFRSKTSTTKNSWLLGEELFCNPADKEINKQAKRKIEPPRWK